MVEDIGALRVETPQAGQRFTQVPIPYSSTLQQLDVLAAYVISSPPCRTPTTRMNPSWKFFGIGARHQNTYACWKS